MFAGRIEQIGAKAPVEEGGTLGDVKDVVRNVLGDDGLALGRATNKDTAVVWGQLSDINCARVDFPEPLAPTMAVNDKAGKSTVMFVTPPISGP